MPVAVSVSVGVDELGGGFAEAVELVAGGASWERGCFDHGGLWNSISILYRFFEGVWGVDGTYNAFQVSQIRLVVCEGFEGEASEDG